MKPVCDVIVVGAGAVGSAALYQLARRGARVMGLDRFHPPHDRGSSHGDTRITRLALGEGEHYVQFARRAHAIWRELEAETGRTLLRQVGGLIYGIASGRTQAHGADDFLQTTIDTARRHGFAHEVLDAAAIAERFPQFRLRGDEVGCLEHGAGFVHPEACIAAQLEVAQRHGAALRSGERVLRWEVGGAGVRVVTEHALYEAGRLIVSAGSWLPGLVSSLRERARVFRQVLFWFGTDGPREWFAPERMPVYIRVPDAGTAMFYGFPAIDGADGAIKIAGEQFEKSVPADEVDAEVRSAEVAAMHALAAPHLRISSHCVRSVVCKYTVTPDFHFVIDHHPESDRVWFASACSGHGFKHSAAVGEALAEIALGGRTRFDISPFRFNRLIGQRGHGS